MIHTVQWVTVTSSGVDETVVRDVLSRKIKFCYLRSVFKSSTAAGSADKLLQHVPIDLPKRCCLSHLGQVVYTEFEAEFLEILNKRYIVISILKMKSEIESFTRLQL